MIAAALAAWSFISGNWRLIAAGAVVAGLAASAIYIDRRASDRCEAGFLAREAATIKEKTDAASHADDAARRCALDPACRMSDDGYKRD